MAIHLAVDATSAAATRLREWLQRARLAPGTKLPSERHLASQLGVSRTTVRSALSLLANDGLLVCHPKRGWFVPQQFIGEPPNELQSFTEMARSLGVRPGSRVLELTERGATLDESVHLRIAPGADVYALHRVRTMDDVPISIDRSVINAALCPGIRARDIEDASLYDLLETRFDLRILRSDYLLQASAADADTARLLLMTPGAPVLIGNDIVIAEPDRPLMISHSFYRGDRYRFRTSLYR